MFLEDELNDACKNNADNRTIVEILRNRLPDPEKVGTKGFENACKQIHFIWKKFCETHRKYNPDGFKEILLSAYKNNESVYKHFNELLK